MSERHSVLITEQIFIIDAINVIDPSMFHLITKDENCDMPTLFSLAIEKKLKTNSFSISKYCLDIGRPEDLIRVKNDYIEHF